MSLLLLAGIGWAADGCSPPIVEFRHVVELSSTDLGTVTDSYRFSVPGGGCPVLSLPRALDGLVLVGGVGAVVDGKMVADPMWKPGHVLVVSSTRELEGGPFSAELQPPAFPVARMVVQITAPALTQLNVWTEPDATVEVSRDKVRRYRASLPGGGRLVWSTYSDWWDVGARLEERVVPKLATPIQLGELAEGIEALTIADGLERASKAVTVDPGVQGFDSAASVEEVLLRGRGSAAERALVLISLLRAGGFDARPALVRPVGSEPGSMSVPAEALFPLPGVYVAGDEPVWIDPRTPYVRVGEMPLGFRGSTALIPGDFPVRLHDDMVPDGQVYIDASGTISEAGVLEVTASVRAERGGLQALRDLLAPLSKDVRQQWLTDLLTSVRPEVSRVRMQVFGVEDPTLPLGMTIEFVEPDVFTPLGAEGLIGVVESVLALHLARVLPPNIEVVETLTLRGATPFVPYGVAPVQDRYDPDALVTREADIDGGAAQLDTRVLRPWRASPRERETEQVLYDAASLGPRVVLFGALDHSIGRELRDEAHNNETRVLEALLWYHAGEPDEAEKSLRRTVRTARFRSLLELLRLYTPRGEMRPWDVVWDAAPDDYARLAVVDALEAKHERREAWRRATELVQSEHQAVQIEALVAVARVQGERPAANVDEAAHRAWREPKLLLKKAARLAEEAYPGQGFQAIDVPMVEQLLLSEECAAAEPVLRRALEGTESPLLRAIHAEWRACMGRPDAAGDLDQILRDAQFHPEVVAAAVRTYERLALFHEARRWAMLGAHLANNDAELWLTASKAAERAGDLRTASYAAGRGSDLRPKSVTLTVPFQIVATLAGDAEAAAVGTERVGYAVSIETVPVSMKNALSFVTEPQRLGLLRLRDRDVLADLDLLTERFQMHLERGDEVGALRDAAWLGKRHRARLGALMMVQATSSSVWSTESAAGLGPAVGEPEVRLLRMKLALLTGSADPYLDVRYLPENAAAEVIREARTDVKALAARVSWPEGLRDPKISAPDGFKKARLLSAVDGAVGLSNKDAGVSLVVTSVEGRLPPPINGVFSVGPEVARVGRITLHELEGGAVPAFVATRRVGDLTWWGVARSQQLARFAVEAGIAAQSIQ